jgi:tRNA(Ile2) C34 agmatinyltransferase TiaS
MKLLIGLDDTDILTSRGTGHLAREVAAFLQGEGHALLGVTRHQLLRDPRVPCTKKNSCAAIHLDVGDTVDLDRTLAQVQQIVVANAPEGSDPGLCLATDVPPTVTAYGQRVQQQLVTQDDARSLAQRHGIPLLGLGGDRSGVIGALAAVGLAAAGNDGRYILVGRIRELQGWQPVAALLDAGVTSVRTRAGETVTEGMVQTDRLRPARRAAQPIAVVERFDGRDDRWLPLKLD